MAKLFEREPKKPYAEPEFTVYGTVRELKQRAGAPVKREPKKPYAEPKFTVYGTIRELTKKQGSRGQLDGGSRLTPRTHV